MDGSGGVSKRPGPTPGSKYAPRKIDQPLLELPYRCGFNPSGKSYAIYVNHIRFCSHRDCDRRYANHLLMQTYFARKYGDGKLDANEHPAPPATTSGTRVPSASNETGPKRDGTRTHQSSRNDLA